VCVCLCLVCGHEVGFLSFFLSLGGRKEGSSVTWLVCLVVAVCVCVCVEVSE
jgi:hypothetical protein